MVNSDTIKWAFNDIPAAYARIGLELPDTLSRWTYKTRFCTNGPGKFSGVSEAHMNPKVQHAVAFLLEPHDAFITDYQCMAGRLRDNKSCGKSKGYVIQSEMPGKWHLRKMLMNRVVPLPMMSGTTSYLFENHGTTPGEFMEWLDVMVDWHLNMKSMSITPTLGIHIYMFKWFGDLMHTKPEGFPQLQAGLAAASDTAHWRLQIANFLKKNTDRLGRMTEASHLVALVLASVCQLHKTNACIDGPPKGNVVAVIDLVEWAIAKLDEQDNTTRQKTTSKSSSKGSRHEREAEL
jgi:hypothetical protein